MAFHDWNHDGQKDWKDNAIEYQLLKNMRKDKSEYTPRRSSGGGMSTFGAILATIAAFFITIFILSLFSKDGVSYPLYVIILSIVVGVLKTIFEK